jgi:hypothetical protein
MKVDVSNVLFLMGIWRMYHQYWIEAMFPEIMREKFVSKLSQLMGEGQMRSWSECLGFGSSTSKA